MIKAVCVSVISVPAGVNCPRAVYQKDFGNSAGAVLGWGASRCRGLRAARGGRLHLAAAQARGPSALVAAEETRAECLSARCALLHLLHETGTLPHF